VPKTCEHFGRFGACNQQAIFIVDKSETKREEWLTGRKIPWSDDPEIIMQPFHPLHPGKLCYYHSKNLEK